MSEASIYRVGAMQPAQDTAPELQEFLMHFDSLRPAGRTGRIGSMFASPNLKQHSRWVIGVSFLRFGDYTTSSEVTVNPETTYIYPISAYESASAYDERQPELRDKAIKLYWDAGMTLAQYIKEHEGNDTPRTGEWEILFTQDDVISVSEVSNKTVVIESADHRREEIMRLLFPKAYDRGIIYGEKIEAAAL